MEDFQKKDTHPLCPCPAFVGLGADRVRGTMPKPGMEVDPASPGGAPLSSLNPVMLSMDHLVDKLTDASVRQN